MRALSGWYMLCLAVGLLGLSGCKQSAKGSPVSGSAHDVQACRASDMPRAYTEEELAITVVEVASVDGGVLGASGDGVLVLEFANKTDRELSLGTISSDWVRTTPSYSIHGDGAGEIMRSVIANASLSWVGRNGSSFAQEVPLSGVRIERRGSSLGVLCIKAPSAAGSYKLTIKINNFDVMVGPAGQPPPNMRFIDWQSTVGPVHIR